MNENYEPILIEIEQDINLINNNSCLRSSLSGLDYAKYLRREQKRTAPIIFTSFLPINYLLAQPRTKILTTIGHDYLQMPYSDQALKAMQSTLKPLNDIQLQDIIINFCGLRSAVRESFHAFKGEIRVIKADVLDKKERYQNLFDAYRTELMKDVGDYPEIIHAYDEMIAKYNPEKEDSIDFILMEQEERFVRFLPPEENNSNETHSEKKPWKVLFLDDKPTELTPIHTILNNRGIQYEVVQSSQEAKEAIEADVLNQITVVVADYRLLESTVQDGWNEPKMQPEQGYDFLLWLSKQDRYNAMVALSGLSKWFLMDSFRRKQMNVKVYSKGGLLGGSAALFVDDLEYLGARIQETLLSLPTASEWKKLKPYYKWLRLECEYADKIEAYVQATADDIINHLDNQLELIKNISDTQKKYIYLELPNKIGRATENLPDFLDLSKLDLFKLKLVYRRVLIYYTIIGKISSNMVAKILNLGSATAPVFDNKGKESDFEYKNMKKQVFNLQAISESDIPFNILIEEKLWLKEKQGMEILSAQVKRNQLYELLEFFFECAKKEIPNLALLPAFKDAFKSGKSTSAINLDLKNFLKQLSANNQHRLKADFIRKLTPVLAAIQSDIHPIESYHVLINTINKC